MLDVEVALGEVISLFVSDYTLHIVYKTPPILIPVVLPLPSIQPLIPHVCLHK